MKLLNCAEDFLKAWYYTGSPPKFKDQPKRYPCIMVIESDMGGLGGDYKWHWFQYYPRYLNTPELKEAYASGFMDAIKR